MMRPSTFFFLVRRTCPIPLFQLCFQRLIRRTHVRFSGAHRHHLDEPHRDFFLLCKFNQFLRMQFFSMHRIQLH